MTMLRHVPHSFLRTDADNEYTFLMPVDPHYIEQEVGIELTDDRRLKLTAESGEGLITAVLTDDIHHHLANRQRRVILTDWEGNPLSTFELSPLKPNPPRGWDRNPRGGPG
jgi:hypothetical protein